MKIEKFIPLEFAANNYLLYDENIKSAVLIDCAGSNEEIFKFIEKNNLILEYILITHAHFDHCLGLKQFREKFPDVKILMAKLMKSFIKILPINAICLVKDGWTLLELMNLLMIQRKLNF